MGWLTAGVVCHVVLMLAVTKRRLSRRQAVFWAAAERLPLTAVRQLPKEGTFSHFLVRLLSYFPGDLLRYAALGAPCTCGGVVPNKSVAGRF